MAEDAARSRLGRGLAALMGEAADEPEIIARSRGQRRAPIEEVRRNPRNPRRDFPEAELEELAASIREKGVIQPIIVRAAVGGGYEIVAGERRWRAAQKAGLHDLPIVVVEADDREALELAIIENVQRADLNPMDEAAGYERLIAEFGYPQAELGRIVGKSRSHIANMLRLLKLPDEVKASVVDGALSAGHARALLAVDDPIEVARKAVTRGLTVRDIEKLARPGEAATSNKTEKATAAKDPNMAALEKTLEDSLGLTVTIQHGPRGGEVRVRYRTLDQLDLVCRRLKD